MFSFLCTATSDSFNRPGCLDGAYLTQYIQGQWEPQQAMVAWTWHPNDFSPPHCPALGSASAVSPWTWQPRQLLWLCRVLRTRANGGGDTGFTHGWWMLLSEKTHKLERLYKECLRFFILLLAFCPDFLKRIEASFFFLMFVRFTLPDYMVSFFAFFMLKCT